MKKFIFAVLAIVVFTACDHTAPKGKCTNVEELQEAITKGSTDTARYDINGDGEITIADINALVATQQNDSTKTECNDSI